MKRNHLKLWACFLIVTMTISISCKKDKGKSRSELLVGSWQPISDVYSPAYDIGTGTAVTEAFPYYEDCTKDDFITFNAANTGALEEGATKCDPGDDQTIPFVWQLTDNDTKLSVTGGAASIATILQLDDKTLKISTTFEDNGTTYTETVTHTRK